MTVAGCGARPFSTVCEQASTKSPVGLGKSRGKLGLGIVLEVSAEGIVGRVLL